MVTLSFMLPPPRVGRWGAICFPVVRRAGRPSVVVVWRDATSVFGCHYSSCECAWLNKSSMSELKGQGHSKVKCTFRTYGRPSVVRAAEAYQSTVWRQADLFSNMI